MSLFKKEICPNCKYWHEEPKPGVNKVCPKCGSTMKYSEKWYMSYRLAGRKVRKAVDPRKRFTEDALGKEKARIRENRFFDTVAEVPWMVAVKDFRTWMKNNVAPDTSRMYENSLKILDPHFKTFTLNSITAQMVEAFKAARLKPKKCPACGFMDKDERKTCPNCRIPLVNALKNTTVNRDIATLKRLFSLAEGWTTKDGKRYIEVNRIAKVPLLSEKGSKRTRWLTEDEIERLLWASRCPIAAGSVRKWIMVLIALDTGLRKESIVILPRRLIVDAAGQRMGIDFKEEKIHTIIKGGKPHSVDMTERLRDDLVQYLNSQKVVTTWLFPFSAHKKRRQAKKGPEPETHMRAGSHFGFEKALEHAGIKDFTFHDLRHTFATHFYFRTHDFKALQLALGHEDFSITMNRYAHLMEEGRKEAHERFDRGKTR